MGTCFVIQPFDKGAFDRRFDDVLVPAIEAANLEPYRVDRDPRVVIPIENIESGIRRAAVCLADVSTDNPNVWYELGYAFAAGKPVVLISRDDRSRRFPFDIQHRHIILYETESPADFRFLQNELTQRLKHAAQIALSPQATSEAEKVGGLTWYEAQALSVLSQLTKYERHSVSGGIFAMELGDQGMGDIHVRLLLQTLEAKGYISRQYYDVDEGPSQSDFTLTTSGAQWLLENDYAIKEVRRAW